LQSRRLSGGAGESGIRRGLSIRCRCSDRSNFGKTLDCVLVVPADGGFPCGRRLRGDVMRAAVETGGVVGQHQVKVGDVDVRIVPVDQRDPIRGHANVAKIVGVAVHDACLTSGQPRPRCSASSNALRRHRAEVDLRSGLGVSACARKCESFRIFRAPPRRSSPTENAGFFMVTIDAIYSATVLGFF